MSIKQAWVGFWMLSLIWGSSFFFIRIGVEELPPVQLVFIRTAIAAIGLTAVVYLRGKRLPKDGGSWGSLLFLGVVNTIVPFVLITWGETYVESGLASVLQGTAALFSLVVAHFTFADERINLRKSIGLITGFVGVVMLAVRDAGEATTSTTSLLYLLGQVAIMAASFCYALGNAYSRKVMQGQLEPIVTSAGAMIVAAIATGIITYGAPLLGGPPSVSLAQLSTRVLAAALMLGLLNTFGAYLIFYPLIQALGAARAAMVTYVIPVVGLLLGALFLDEVVDLWLVLGAILIVGSIAIVNLNYTVLVTFFSKRFALGLRSASDSNK